MVQWSVLSELGQLVSVCSYYLQRISREVYGPFYCKAAGNGKNYSSILGS